MEVGRAGSAVGSLIDRGFAMGLSRADGGIEGRHSCRARAFLWLSSSEEFQRDARRAFVGERGGGVSRLEFDRGRAMDEVMSLVCQTTTTSHISLHTRKNNEGGVPKTDRC